MTVGEMASPVDRLTIPADPATDEYSMVFREHYDGLLRFAYVLTGNQSEAEDVVAEAFARVMPKWKRGGIENLAAYLRRAVVNESNGRFRRLRLQRREDNRRRADVECDPAPDDRVVAKLLVARLLLELSPQQRAVVVLRHLEDRSEAECAEILGITTGSVKAYLSRALDRLRALADGGKEQ